MNPEPIRYQHTSKGFEKVFPSEEKYKPNPAWTTPGVGEYVGCRIRVHVSGRIIKETCTMSKDGPAWAEID